MKEDSIKHLLTDTIVPVQRDSADMLRDSIGSLDDSLSYEPAWNALCTEMDSLAQGNEGFSLCDSLVPFRSHLGELFTYGLPLQYGFLRNPWVQGCLLLAFLLLVCLFAWYRKYMKAQLISFFVPGNNPKQQSLIKTSVERYVPFFLIVTECVVCGLLLFSYAGTFFDFQLGILPPSLVLLSCILSFALYNLVRWMVYAFVNWIFFQPAHRKRWNDGFSLLSTLESLSLFPILVVSIHFNLSFDDMLMMLLVTYSLLRFLLLYNSYRIFFGKLYGIVHLFAYLCTLELLPLASLWGIMQVLSNVLIVK